MEMTEQTTLDLFGSDGGPQLTSTEARGALGELLDGRIDPSAVETRHRLRRTSSFEEVPFIWSGAWNLDQVDADSQVQYIWDLMGARGDPERSASFRRNIEAVERGAIKRVGFILLATEDDLRWHFACYHRIAVSIATHGFSGAGGSDAVTPSGRHIEPKRGNPRISIDADGQPHWSGDGRHRVAIAQWLGLPSIPITVRSVDGGWLRSQSKSHDKSPLATITDRLAELRPSEGPGLEDRSMEWLGSVMSLDPAPELQFRPDPHGSNESVGRALRLHRDARWSEADEAWSAAGAGRAAPAHVDVMAAHTAFAAGDVGRARRLVDDVLAGDDCQLAASELADRMAG